MLNLYALDKYKENNRLEAKRAHGGLPQSLWETYCSFANTFGGIILLGVEELPDKTLKIAGLEKPEELLEQFWEVINNPSKISKNILSEENVTTENINGKQIIVIRVPKAHKKDKPIYVGNSPYSGSYRRSGDGDYKCSDVEVLEMVFNKNSLP